MRNSKGFVKPSPLNDDDIMEVNWAEYYRVSNGERRCRKMLIGPVIIAGLLLIGMSFSCSAYEGRREVIKIDLANGGQLIARPVYNSGSYKRNEYYIDADEAKDQLGHEFNDGVPVYFDGGSYWMGQ